MDLISVYGSSVEEIFVLFAYWFRIYCLGKLCVLDRLIMFGYWLAIGRIAIDRYAYYEFCACVRVCVCDGMRKTTM